MDGQEGSAEAVLKQRVSFLIGVIANRLVKSGSAFYRRHFGVGFTDWRIMLMLSLEPGVPARRIAEVVALDKAAVSRGLRDLDLAGLIEPTAGRRSREYRLSAKGHELQVRISAIASERQRRLLAGIAPHELPLLLDMLQRILAETPQLETFKLPG